MQCQLQSEQEAESEPEGIQGDKPSIDRDLEIQRRVTPWAEPLASQRGAISTQKLLAQAPRAPRTPLRPLSIVKAGTSLAICPVTQAKKNRFSWGFDSNPFLHHRRHQTITIPQSVTPEVDLLPLQATNTSQTSGSPSTVTADPITISETSSINTVRTEKNSAISVSTVLTAENTPDITKLQGLWVSTSPKDARLLEVWINRIEPRLRSELFAHIDETWTLEFLLVGKSICDLRPTILVTCVAKKAKKRVEKLYRSLTWLRDLNKQHRIQFVSLLSQTRLTTLLRADRDHSAHVEWMEVYLSLGPETYCGSAIKIIDKSAATSSTCVAGGLVLVDGKVCILTTGHSFSFRSHSTARPPYCNDPDSGKRKADHLEEPTSHVDVLPRDEDDTSSNASSDASSDAESTPCIFDEEDEDYGDAISSDWLDATTNFQNGDGGVRDGNLLEARGNQTLPCSDHLDSSPRELSQLLHISRPQQDGSTSCTATGTDKDWALLSVPRNVLLPNRDTSGRGINETTVIPNESRHVTIISPAGTATDTLLAGTLHPLAATLKFNSTCYEAYRITTNFIWPSGTSGAWVLLDGKLCGQIVAARQEEPWLYMVSIQSIFDDIKHQLGASQVLVYPQDADVQDFDEHVSDMRRELPTLDAEIDEMDLSILVDNNSNNFGETQFADMRANSSHEAIYQAAVFEPQLSISQQDLDTKTTVEDAAQPSQPPYSGLTLIPPFLTIPITDAERNSASPCKPEPLVRFDPNVKLIYPNSPVSTGSPTPNIYNSTSVTNTDRTAYPLSKVSRTELQARSAQVAVSRAVSQTRWTSYRNTASHVFMLLPRTVEWLVIRHEMRVRRLRQFEEGASFKLRFELFFYKSLASTIKVSFKPKDTLCACKGVSIFQYMVLLPVTLLYFLLFGIFHLWYYVKHRDLFESSKSRLKRYTATMAALRQDPSCYDRWKKPGPTFFRHHGRKKSEVGTPEETYEDTSLLMYQIFEMADQRRQLEEGQNSLYHRVNSHVVVDEECDLQADTIRQDIQSKPPSSTKPNQPPKKEQASAVSAMGDYLTNTKSTESALPLCGRNRPQTSEIHNQFNTLPYTQVGSSSKSFR